MAMIKPGLIAGRRVENPPGVGIKELIVALSQRFRGKRITSEQATEALGEYLRASHACSAYSQTEQADAR